MACGNQFRDLLTAHCPVREGIWLLMSNTVTTLHRVLSRQRASPAMRRWNGLRLHRPRMRSPLQGRLYRSTTFT